MKEEVSGFPSPQPSPQQAGARGENLRLLETLVDILGQSEGQTIEEVKAELEADGVDVEASIGRLMDKVRQCSEEARMREEIEKRFTYQAPKPGQPERYVTIRDKAKEFASLILELTPGSREQSLAITAIEEAVMWANAAIVRRE